ncbi:MAG: hypothetical protein HMLIMOIP_000900, partial [Candidatus Nitrosomirales archaeon]
MLMAATITVASPSDVNISFLSLVNPSAILTAISNLAQSIDARFLYLINPSSVFTTLSAYAEAMITTDKADYAPGETVIISGSGFLPNSSITLTITHPDLNIVTWSATSDANGSFTTTYTLDAFAETYTVTATDGTYTASTTFTDSSTITGTKFGDKDGSGTISSGSLDDKIQGWIIAAYGSGATAVATDVTGNNGAYTLSPGAGTFIVCEELTPGVTELIPTGNTLCVGKTPPLGASSLAPAGYSVVLSGSGGPASGNDFLNSGVVAGASHVDFTQCENDSSNTNTINNCNWVTGGLNQNNAFFTEGDVVPHRLFHTIDTAGTHTMRLTYDFSQANIYAYDFASTPTITQSGALLAQCDDLPGFVSGATCSSIFSGATSASILSDPFDAVSSREDPASRTWLVGGSSSISGVSIAFGNTVADGEAGEDHDPDTDLDCFQTCASSSVVIEVTFTTSSANTIVGLWMGLHLAEAADPPGPAVGWGTGFGSSDVSGAPFHYKYTKLDGASVGNRDNQIQSAGVVTPGTIIVKKNAIPNGPTNFNFTSTIPSVPTFKLNDTGDNVGNMTMFSVAPGTYNVTETLPVASFSLTNIVCVDSITDDSSEDVPNGNATAVVEAGETVTCTFTNNKLGKITIIKDTVPDDPQFFNYTTIGLSPSTFDLDDDGTENNPLNSTIMFLNLSPGMYNVTELLPVPGFTLSDIACVDPTTNSLEDEANGTAKITIDDGETVTCTFTNNKLGKITIIKDTVPDDPQFFNYTTIGLSPSTF